MSAITSASRPKVVTTAASLLALDALLGVASVHALLYFYASQKGLVLPFQPGEWLVALLQVLAAVLLFQGKAWPRYVLAAWLFFLIGDTLLNSNFLQRYESFRMATIRDGISFSLQVASLALLFMPAASAWFEHVRKNDA